MVAEAEIPRPAVERMRRMMYFAIGVSALLFGVLLAPGNSGFLGQIDQLHPIYAYFTVAVVFVLPASFPLLTFILPGTVMRVLVLIIGSGFICAQLFFIAAMNNEHLDGAAAPWFQGFGAIPAALLAIAWSRPVAWTFALAQGPLVATVALFARDDSGEKALLDGLGAMVTCTILVGVASAVGLGAWQQDEVAHTAGISASREASALTREREQARINAMVHDDIMSVLLSASRVPAPAGLAAQATVALRSVETLTAPQDARRLYSPDELVAILRSTVGEVNADVTFVSTVESINPVPSVAVAAVAEAAGEAIRNSVLHAGDDAARKVSVRVDDAGVAVSVEDDGDGFSPRSVAPRRLGIRVSILERMRSLDGGDARVVSRPGGGTTINLTWTRERM